MQKAHSFEWALWLYWGLHIPRGARDCSDRRVTARRTKLLVLSISVFTVLLSKYFIASITVNKKSPSLSTGAFSFIGSLAVYYSRMATATLPSSQLRFTSEFGMDSGGSTALLPPGKNCLSVFN